jgi:histidine ammonia-lyase
VPFRIPEVVDIVDWAGLESPAAVDDALAAIAGLRASVAELIPRDPAGGVAAAWVARLAALPVRDQLAALDEHLAPARSVALTLLRIVQEPTFPKRAPRARAESALVEALDALRKAVPDTPPVQDDYSLRCAPQVLAGAYRAHEHVSEIVEVEINSATDNPLLFPFAPDEGFAALGVADTAPIAAHYQAYRDWLTAARARVARCREAVLGGGNFHGQPVATAMDYLAIAVAEVGSIAERRVAHIVDPNHSHGLPAFLIDGSGLNSGFMIPQYTAAALVSENKGLCHPASTDSIPTCANSEDHVSMGTIAARKCRTVVRNVRYVVAIELLAAYQALWFREPLEPGAAVAVLRDAIRSVGVERYRDDRVIAPDIAAVDALLAEPTVLNRAIRAATAGVSPAGPPSRILAEDRGE